MLVRGVRLHILQISCCCFLVCFFVFSFLHTSPWLLANKLGTIKIYNIKSFVNERPRPKALTADRSTPRCLFHCFWTKPHRQQRSACLERARSLTNGVTPCDHVTSFTFLTTQVWGHVLWKWLCWKEYRQYWHLNCCMLWPKWGMETSWVSATSPQAID